MRKSAMSPELNRARLMPGHKLLIVKVRVLKAGGISRRGLSWLYHTRVVESRLGRHGITRLQIVFMKVGRPVLSVFVRGNDRLYDLTAANKSAKLVLNRRSEQRFHITASRRSAWRSRLRLWLWPTPRCPCGREWSILRTGRSHSNADSRRQRRSCPRRCVR